MKTAAFAWFAIPLFALMFGLGHRIARRIHQRQQARTHLLRGDEPTTGFSTNQTNRRTHSVAA